MFDKRRRSSEENRETKSVAENNVGENLDKSAADAATIDSNSANTANTASEKNNENPNVATNTATESVSEKIKTDGSDICAYYDIDGGSRVADEKNIIALDSVKKKSRFFTADLVKCVVVLAVIALVAGALLGVMNWLTYVDPDETIKGKVSSYYAVSVDAVQKMDGMVINESGGAGTVEACYVAYDGDIVKGYAYYAIGTGAKDGTISLIVYVDPNGVLCEIAVYEQGETAGYFKRVEKANKSKYVGLNLNEIDGLKFYKKASDALADGEVVAVSGATLTSRGYHNAVAAAVYAYKNYEEA